MKKKMFWLAAMAVTVSMASCSLNEVMEQPEPQAIGFSSFVGKPTKAANQIINPGAVGDGTALSKFYVFGNYGDATGTYTNEVFSNTEVSVSSTGTEISTAQYWIPNKFYKFAAYSNGNSSLTVTSEVSFDENGHITITDYSAGTNDLILATPNEVQTSLTISAGSPGAVELTFSHLLSQVGFQFANGFTNGYTVKITNLKFSVPNKATYSYQTSAYSWDTPDTNNDKEYTVNGNNAFDNSVAQSSEYNFVIPQSNMAFNASFTVTVYDNNGTQVIEKSFSNVSLATGTTTAPGGDDNVWTPGYKYKYTATIDASVLDDVMFPIKFKVDAVEIWKESTGGNSSLPLN